MVVVLCNAVTRSSKLRRYESLSCENDQQQLTFAEVYIYLMGLIPEDSGRYHFAYALSRGGNYLRLRSSSRIFSHLL